MSETCACGHDVGQHERHRGVRICTSCPCDAFGPQGAHEPRFARGDLARYVVDGVLESDVRIHDPSHTRVDVMQIATVSVSHGGPRAHRYYGSMMTGPMAGMQVGAYEDQIALYRLPACYPEAQVDGLQRLAKGPLQAGQRHGGIDLPMKTAAVLDALGFLHSRYTEDTVRIVRLSPLGHLAASLAKHDPCLSRIQWTALETLAARDGNMLSIEVHVKARGALARKGLAAVDGSRFRMTEKGSETLALFRRVWRGSEEPFRDRTDPL